VALAALILAACLSLGSRCNASRWANPETGIPPYPGGPPPVGYISPRPPPVEPEPPRDAVSDAGPAAPDAAPEVDADTTDASPAADENPY
jgi:hypothetical protein